MKLDVSHWLNALDLSERCALLRSAEDLHNIDEDLAQRRFKKWHSQLPFTRPQYLRQRLALQGLDEAGFLRILGTGPEHLNLRPSALPEWLCKLELILQDYEGHHQTSCAETNGACAAAEPSLPPSTTHPGEEEPAEARTAELLTIAEPFVQEGRQQLLCGAEVLQQTYGRSPFDLGTVDSLFLHGLQDRLSMILARTLVLELNVARVKGRLQGETSEDRFHSFLHLLAEPENATAFFREYAVLTRLLVMAVSQWKETCLELLARLCEDWPAIHELLEIPEHSLLSGVQMGAGDSHRGGRSVSILQFDSGEKIVYKPHSLAVNANFSKLLAWLNQHGFRPKLHELKVLNRGSHGWTEFVVARGCASEEELQRFYRRLGGLAALVNLLNATDLHLENLFASGEHPILVDLESLFHPQLPLSESKPALRISGMALEKSALRTGLLPQRIWVGPEGGGVDMSGFGGSGDQLTPDAVPIAENEGTDEMKFVRKRVKFGTATQNRPTLEGAKVALSRFATDVVAGFEEMYRLMWRLRDEMLAGSGPLSWFAEDEVRVILRPTKTYGQILWNSLHPNVLRNGLDRDRALDRLWVAIEHRPELAKLVSAEQADLRAGDIPVFTARPASTSIWTSTGAELADFLKEGSLSTARSNLMDLCEDDLAKQLWFIRGSIASTEPVSQHSPLKTSASKQSATAVNMGQILEATQSIVRKIESKAFCRDGREGCG